MRLAVVAMLLASLTLHVAPAAEPASIRFEDLAEVHYKSELPKFIRTQLQMDASGMAGVAEIGERFFAGEASVENLPTRRLLGAGSRGDTWLVVIEQGGKKGPELRLLRFEGEKLVSETNAGTYGSVLPPTFRSVIEKFVDAPAARPPGPMTKMSGVSIGVTLDEVLKLLGPPREAFGSTYPILRYKGLDIWVNKDSRVSRMRSTSPAHCLGATLCPGKPPATAQATLGASWWTHYETTRFPFDLDTCWVDIGTKGAETLSGATIASIDVVCEAQR